MKKLITLLTLLTMIGGGKLWADTETIFSANPTTAWSVPASTTDAEITSSYATISGGKMYVTNEQTSAKDMLKEQGEMAFQHTNNNTFFKVVLNKTLEAGDVISARMQSRTDADLGLWFSTATTRPNECTAKIDLATASSQAWVTAPTYTVAEGDGICGEKTFYIYRATGKSTYFNTFTITREVAATAPSITTQPVGAKYAPNAVATALSVVATASAGTLSYQWYSNTTESTEGATAISGATSAEYTPSTATEGTTYYYCVVTDGNGSVTSDIVAIKVTNSTEAVVGYTEAINGTTLDARVLTGADNITISDPIFGSAITNSKGTSKEVYIDGTKYNNTDSWRKSVNGAYDNQFVGYTLTVAPGFKMNISNVNARLVTSDDVSYTWYVEILNSAGTQVWKSGERTTTRSSSGKIDNVNVSDKDDIQGLTGNVTVKLWMKQGGSTKYFSINYLQLTVETEVDNRPTYAMTVSQNIAEAGTVTPDDGSTVTEGESVAFTATPIDTYKFVKWTIDGQDYTENPYVMENVNAAHTAVATFAKRYIVTYNLGEEAGTIGKVLNNVNRGNGYDEVYSADDDTYTIPAYADKYLYKEGYVFDKWEDADGNTYASGATINMTKDITLTPTFKATTQSLDASSAETVVSWTFAKADILFTDWQNSSKYGYYTKNIEVNGETIAIPMTITDGKVGNWSRTDAIAQTNQNTKFTIPAVSGMTIELTDAYKEFSTTTIAGSTDYEGTGTKSISYTYEGTDATIDIVIGESSQYLNTIKVTYPAAAITAAITAAGYATFSNASEVAIPEGVKAYYATKQDASTILLTEIEGGVIPAAEGVVLEGAEGTYTFAKSNTGAGNITENLLKANLTAGEPTESEYYTLAAGPKFVKSAGGTLAAGKAYLVLPAGNAREMKVAFHSETTGITMVENTAVRNSYYNINGQRVAQPTKGLYIVNGKKVMVK